MILIRGRDTQGVSELAVLISPRGRIEQFGINFPAVENLEISIVFRDTNN